MLIHVHNFSVLHAFYIYSFYRRSIVFVINLDTISFHNIPISKEHKFLQEFSMIFDEIVLIYTLEDC